MKKIKFTESQIIKALKENEQGRKVEDICRELGIHRGTFYNRSGGPLALQICWHGNKPA